MKTIYAFFMILCLTACKDAQTSNEKTGNSLTSSLSASVDGVDYNAQFVSGHVSEITSTLVLTGAMGTGEDIQLFVPVTISEGSHAYQLPIQGKYQATDDFENGGFAVSGNLQIRKHAAQSRHIEGTFQFKTKGMDVSSPSFNITNGVFDIYY